MENCGLKKGEVNRVMRLIFEVFLRELICNASNSLDKIRLLSLTNKSILDATEELTIKVKADKENKVLQITDNGIGMTKEDLINNLETIAKSGASEFLGKIQGAASAGEMSDVISQFGVGFYSAFLVADKVVVTSKNNDGTQHIWESDGESFSAAENPRGTTLKRGTQISIYLKEEAHDFLEQDTVRDLIKKYSQFINFNVYLWGSSTYSVEEPIEDNKEEKKPKTKNVEKTTWDWKLCNSAKPILARKPDDNTTGEAGASMDREEIEVAEKEKVGPTISKNRQHKKKKSTYVGYCGHKGCDFVATSTSTEISINKVINCQCCQHFNFKLLRNKDRNENIQQFNHMTSTDTPLQSVSFVRLLLPLCVTGLSHVIRGNLLSSLRMTENHHYPSPALIPVRT